jgi:hypothetical protein
MRPIVRETKEGSDVRSLSQGNESAVQPAGKSAAFAKERHLQTREWLSKAGQDADAMGELTLAKESAS